MENPPHGGFFAFGAAKKNFVQLYWFGYIVEMPKMRFSPQKRIVFLGNSLKNLRDFPRAAREDCGYQLHKVQTGGHADDFKPMPSVGKGVEEVRVRDEDGIYRVIYTARFEDSVYVLHAFQKKTEKTSLKDVELARDRFKMLLNEIAAAKQQEGKA
jgi:phage-related protein